MIIRTIEIPPDTPAYFIEFSDRSQTVAVGLQQTLRHIAVAVQDADADPSMPMPERVYRLLHVAGEGWRFAPVELRLGGLSIPNEHGFSSFDVELFAGEMRLGHTTGTVVRL